eukprot:gb/GECG01011000.1/.p1 GENE.gb/GECG01011000.1/~~gb/GECG01011000.1/.p1  ORF type:complete len:542 (+),score=70.46 gb/GECG01011000.1/:1-1626(+)
MAVDMATNMMNGTKNHDFHEAFGPSDVHEGTTENPKAVVRECSMGSHFPGLSGTCMRNGTETPLLRSFINGNWGSTEETVPLENPATGRVIAHIPRNQFKDVEQAVSAAEIAFKSWGSTGTEERAKLLDKIADGIEKNCEFLAKLESEDSGKTLQMARTIDIPRAVQNFRFYAGQIRHDSTDCHLMDSAVNYSLRVPLGICGLITPWNLPLYLLSWKVAPALAMGNCIVAKPSELTPRTATALADIIKEAGVPDGVFNLLHGYGHEVGQAIIEHPKIVGISFTGGTVTGRKVAATAAPMFKKLSLELGGKNPTIVFADCDLEKTVAGACRSAFTNSGQVCLAGSRIFVERSIYQEFLEKFVEKAKSMTVGDPNDPNTQLGPVSSYQHLEKIRWYLDKAEEEGGRILCGGKQSPPLPAGFENGFFISPTVIDGLSPDSTPSKEEIFGPVCTVHPFEAEDELLEAANNVRYGLAGSIWTNNLNRAHRLASKVQVGILWINCWLLRDLRTPFGGVKDSGIGREGGKHSLEFYSEYRNVCIKYDA